MNKMIEKINGQYVLTAADGIRIITRDEVSHQLLAVLTSAPAIGQVVIRNLNSEETAEYTAIRRTERNIRKAVEAAEKAAEKKAADKAEHRAAVHAKWAEKKAKGKATQAETEVYTAVKELERAEKQEVPVEPATADNSREELKAQVTEIRRYIEAAADVDPDAVEDAKQQLAELHSKLAGWKETREVRRQAKAEIRERAKGYSLKTYGPDEVWRHVMDLVESLRGFIYTQETTKEEIELARVRYQQLEAKLFVEQPLTIRRSQGRIVRLNKSAISEVLRVDYESKKPTTKMVVVNHGIQETFNFHWSLFATDEETGKKRLANFINRVTDQFLWYGVKELQKDGSAIMFGAAGSSSGHIKQEKVLMAQSKLMKEHEQFFWFGKTMDEFSKEMTTSGAEFWKIRANLLRPWMKPFRTKDGTEITLNDILVVRDTEKVYRILHGRKIGRNEKTGEMFTDGQFDEPVTLGDGAMIAIYPLAFQGQASTALFKGFLADGTSSIVELCKKHGISVEDFLNMEVEGIDGKMHRIGDYKVICGDGCWKGSKAFKSYTDYVGWMSEMKKVYPDIDKVYLLRQAEEIEDEEKVRRLTRTLIQQWMHMGVEEIRKITSRALKCLQRDKTFTGALNKLAGLWKSEEERTEVEKLFEECPWLICSPVIQQYLGEQWNRKQIEAASGKFRTEGQYPYIMQDPVALLEVWVLGVDPNSPDLGVLKTGEVSCADVPDGRKVLCVRFPANFLTAQVKINRACQEAFASLNGVMILSVHDLILIVQDGDVDGDEMCVIYNRLAIKITERMQKEFNPPVILFQHGGKPKRSIAGSKREFVRRMAVALADAKRYDSVGLYANLAMRCCYLATIAYRNRETKEMEKYLLWMSAASTGAIMALDQVKGNDVDLRLVNWLNDNSKTVDKAFQRLAQSFGYDYKTSLKMRNPYIQWYVAENKRRPIEWSKCLPFNPDNYLDCTCQFILEKSGKWEDFDFEGTCWNEQAAYDSLTNSLPIMQVPAGTVTQQMIDLLGDNWFKLKRTDMGVDPDLETLKKFHIGGQVGLKELVLLLWRNESSMAYSMEGRQLWEKKEEYYTVCRELLRMLVQNGDWSKKTVEIKPEDRWNILVNALVKDALELLMPVGKDGKKRTNGVDKKGSYAMFVLKLIAPELRRNVKKNCIDQERFFGVTLTAEDLEIESKREQMEDEAELFESSSFTPDEPAVPEYSDDQLDQMAPPEEECAFSISEDIDYSQCPDY